MESSISDLSQNQGPRGDRRRPTPDNNRSTKRSRYKKNLLLIAAFSLFPLVASQQIFAQYRGAVYTQTNRLDGNEIAAFRQLRNGTLEFIGNFPTGGNGSTEFDGGEGLDPLISAESVVVTENERYLITVNAGSNSITSFRIRRNFELKHISTVPSGGVGPNSIAVRRGRLYVTNIDRDGVAPDGSGQRGEPNDEGNVVGFTIDRFGVIRPIPNATVNLDNRPADIGFSANGRHLIVSSLNAGSAALEGENSENYMSVFALNRKGEITGLVGSAVGTPQGNEQGRNLPTAVDFDTTRIGRREFVVVTEAREFNADGSPPQLPLLQAGSVSVFQLERDGSLTSIADDLSIGDPADSPFDETSQLTSCWIDFGIDGRTFYVANAINATISSFRLNRDGQPELLDALAGEGTSGFSTGGTTGEEVFGASDGFIDLDVSGDGRYLFQLEGLTGRISVFRVNRFTGRLRLIQEASGDLPEVDTQGIVSVSARRRTIRGYRDRLIDLFLRLF